MAESRAATARQKDEQRSRRESSGLARRDIFPSFPSPLTASPFALMRWMNDEIDRVFGRVPAAEEAIWSPRIETFQRGDTLVLRAELPGLSREDVQVEVNEDSLVLQGERREEHEEEDEGFYRSEWSYGRFHREIPLPEGALPDSARASFKDGVLEIELKAPPREVSRGRKIEITEGGARKE